MKKYVDIYIGGQAVDVDVSGLSLSIQYSIEEADLGKVRGSHSKRSINLPATSVNAAIAESVQDPASITSSAGTLQPARIEVNGMPVLSGKAQLTDVDLIRRGYGLRAAGYKYAFFGSNADWFQDLGDLRIRDLGWADKTITTSGVEATYTPADETCFTVIKWAEWFQSSAIRHVDHTPAIFVSSILQKAFNSIGYNINSLYDSDPWNRLIIPVPLNLDGEYSNNSVNIRVESSAAQTIAAPTTTATETVIDHDKETPAPNKDPGNRYNEVGHTNSQAFKAPIKGLYRLSFVTNFIDFLESGSGFPDDQTVYMGFKKNGADTFGFTKVYDSTVSQSGGIGPHEITWSGTLEADDEVQCFIETQTSTISSDPFDLTSIFVVEFEKDQWFLGDPVPWKNIIPLSWKVRDLITDLTKAFNLKWETDVQAGTVNAWPADYYALTYRADATGASTTSAFDGFFYRDNASDMSQYFDVARGGKLEIITDQQRDYVLDWKTDDETTEAIQNAKGVSLYSGRWRFPANRFPEGEKRITTGFFAKTLHLPANTIYSSSSTNFIPQIPFIYPENYLNTTASEPDYDTAPRLLYYAGRRGGYDGYINLYYTDTSATSAYDFPASFMVNYNDPSGVDVSLSFCNETTNSGQTVIGLLTRFHAQSLKRMEVGKMYEYYLFWDEMDLAALSFRYRVEIDGDKYILQTIDGYNPLSNVSTKTRLLMDAVPTESDLAKITGPVGPGEAAVEGGSGNAGGYLGEAVLAGSQSGYYEQVFTAPVAQTIDISENNGTLPSNKAQIWVMTSNGQIITSPQFTVTNNDGANDQISFNWIPFDGDDIIVRFRYP